MPKQLQFRPEGHCRPGACDITEHDRQIDIMTEMDVPLADKACMHPVLVTAAVAVKKKAAGL